MPGRQVPKPISFPSLISLNVALNSMVISFYSLADAKKAFWLYDQRSSARNGHAEFVKDLSTFEMCDFFIVHEKRSNHHFVLEFLKRFGDFFEVGSSFKSFIPDSRFYPKQVKSDFERLMLRCTDLKTIRYLKEARNTANMYFPDQFNSIERKLLLQMSFFEEETSTFLYFNFTNNLQNFLNQSQNKENQNGRNAPTSNQESFELRHSKRECESLEIIPRLLSGKDQSRTTVMMRNIPNRYDIFSLLELIEPDFKGTFDFLYAPIDFVNKCNMGYAFINFTDTRHVIRFHQKFHQKNWTHVHSSKICCVCFARIQGRNQLISHFKRNNYLRLNLEPRMLPFIVPSPSQDFFIF